MKNKRIKRKLKNWVKILIVSIISFIIYTQTGAIGKLVQNNPFGELICIATWLWLFMGQFIFMYFIIDDRK